MTQKTSIWLRALVAAVVTGGCNALLNVLGIAGANAVGVPVASLDGKQLLSSVIVGAIIGAAAYLKQSPVPPAE